MLKEHSSLFRVKKNDANWKFDYTWKQRMMGMLNM